MTIDLFAQFAKVGSFLGTMTTDEHNLALSYRGLSDEDDDTSGAGNDPDFNEDAELEGGEGFGDEDDEDESGEEELQ